MDNCKHTHTHKHFFPLSTFSSLLFPLLSFFSSHLLSFFAILSNTSSSLLSPFSPLLCPFSSVLFLSSLILFYLILSHLILSYGISSFVSTSLVTTYLFFALPFSSLLFSSLLISSHLSTVDGALSSAFLWEVRDQGSKSEIFPPTSLSFEFDFERSSATKADLKELIHQVIIKYNILLI